MLDANSVIYLLSGAFPKLTARVADIEVGAIGVSAIAFAEASTFPEDREIYDHVFAN